MPCYTRWDACLPEGSDEYAAKRDEMEAKLKAVLHIVDYYYGASGWQAPPASFSASSGMDLFHPFAHDHFRVEGVEAPGVDEEQGILDSIVQHFCCDEINSGTLYDLVSLLDLKDPAQAGYARVILLCAIAMRGMGA